MGPADSVKNKLWVTTMPRNMEPQSENLIIGTQKYLWLKLHVEDIRKVLAEESARAMKSSL